VTDPQTYQVPAQMLQAMINVIGQRPAFEVLDLMNGIRQLVEQQNAAAKEAHVAKAAD